MSALGFARAVALGFTRLTLSQRAAGGNAVLAVTDSKALVFPDGSAFQSTPHNSIGAPGAQGFGVGICPALPVGYSALYGATDPASNNYGNYQYSDGSVMVWVPAFYYKVGTDTNGLAINRVDVKPYISFADVATANADGYALHRAFYNAGAVQLGVFVDKYQCSNNAGVASSVKNGNPLSGNSAHNPLAA
jgi:hypothetical protein